MTGKTHVAVGLATSVIILKFNLISVPSELPFYTSVALGSLLPDIDHAGSTIGSKVPILPHLLKHRGVTHKVELLVLLMFLLALVLPLGLVWGFGIGYGMHLVGDVLTKSGLELSLLIPINISVPIIRNRYLDHAVFLFSLFVIARAMI